MSEDFLNIISKVAQASILLPLIIGIIRFRHLAHIQKVLLLFLGVALVISTAAWYMWSNRMNNLPLLHVYTVLEFIAWASIFYLLFKGEKGEKLIISLSVGFIIFAVINSLFIQTIFTFNSYSRSAGGVILICFSLLYFGKLFKEKKVPQVEQNAYFWINAAVLVYFSGAFLLFGFSNLLLNLSSYEIKEVWGVHALFLLSHYILLTFGIWKKSAPQISL